MGKHISGFGVKVLLNCSLLPCHYYKMARHLKISKIFPSVMLLIASPDSPKIMSSLVFLVLNPHALSDFYRNSISLERQIPC